MPLLCISANQQGKPYLRHQGQSVRPPLISAQLWGRQVRSFCIITRKTECHRKNRDPVLIVKRLAIDAHPLAQPLPRGVGKGTARDVDPRTGRLPYHHNPRSLGQPDNGAGLVGRFGDGEPLCTKAAIADLLYVVRKTAHWWPCNRVSGQGKERVIPLYF